MSTALRSIGARATVAAERGDPRLCARRHGGAARPDRAVGARRRVLSSHGRVLALRLEVQRRQGGDSRGTGARTRDGSGGRTTTSESLSEGRPARACSVRRMPDMPALDVAIGLVFIYALVLFVCSTINESISTAVGLRARLLHKGILNLLSAAPGDNRCRGRHRQEGLRPSARARLDPAGTQARPSIDPRKKAKPWRKPPYPSYLPSRTFVAALTDLARDAETKIKDADSKDDSEEEEAARARVRQPPMVSRPLPPFRTSSCRKQCWLSTEQPAARRGHSSMQPNSGSTTRWSASPAGTGARSS